MTTNKGAPSGAVVILLDGYDDEDADEAPARRKSRKVAPQDSVEKRTRSELKDLGLTARSVGPLATFGVIAINLAQTMDRTAAARDLAALSRELRQVMERIRQIAVPAKGDEVDEVANNDAGGSAGAPAEGDPPSNVRVFGRPSARPR